LGKNSKQKLPEKAGVRETVTKVAYEISVSKMEVCKDKDEAEGNNTDKNDNADKSECNKCED
jgi:hypothetical protein